jgi:hypothetical protein
MKIPLDFGAFRRQMKLCFDARDYCRRHELAIGIQEEQLARPVEDDASAQSSYSYDRTMARRAGFTVLSPRHCAQVS